MDKSEELNQFLASVEKRAYAMAVMAVKNPDDALDIVQDVMLTLARKYARKPNAEWAPLFYRILKNRITDFHRAASIKQRVFGWMQRGADDVDSVQDPIELAVAPYQSNPEHQQAMNGVGEQLQAALEQLPARQREAFMLRSWEGLDVKSTAVAMGCSSGSVKTHFSRAVHALRRAMEGYDDV